MAKKQLCLTALVCLLSASIISAFTPSVPVIAWSNKDYLGVSNTHYSSLLDDVLFFVPATPAPVTEYAQTNHPDVVIAFSFDHLAAHELSEFGTAYSINHRPTLKHLQQAVESSLNSFSSPFVAPSTTSSSSSKSATTLRETLVHRIKKNPRARVTQLTAAQCDSVASVDSSIFGNGVTDLIEIKFKDASELHLLDECIGNVMADLVPLTNDNFVAVVFANSAPSFQMEFEHEGKFRPFRFSAFASLLDTQQTNGSNSTSTQLHASPDILAGIFLAFFLILLFFWMLSWLFDITTPLRFHNKRFVVGKEY